MYKKNKNFTNSLGFIISCIGAAVGLGNIWMFPYRLGECGGAAFLIPYILFVCLFGFIGLSAELAFGRITKMGVLGSYEYCWDSIGKKNIGKIIGWIALLGSHGISIGYAVIIAWVFKYLIFFAIKTNIKINSISFFNKMSTGMHNQIYHTIVIIIAILILISGAINKIEKLNKILMPSFFILFTILSIRVFFLHDSYNGYRFLFIPKWYMLTKLNTWIMAMGQAFFSLSITGSSMIVYGSYLNKTENIPKAAIQITFFDTIGAILSALTIMPAVFAFHIKPSAGSSLMFITMPNVFHKIMFGRIFAIFFFISVFFAGFTSLINMLEAVIESWQQKFKLHRYMATIICGITTLSFGILIEDKTRIEYCMDFISTLIVPFSAMLCAISVYYIIGIKKIKQELEYGRKKHLNKYFKLIAIYIYVPFTIIIFISSLLNKGIE